MWDLTPDTDLFEELPEEYAFETALADLIVSGFTFLISKFSSAAHLLSFYRLYVDSYYVSIKKRWVFILCALVAGQFIASSMVKQ